MTISRRVRAVATAALLLAGMTACANSDGGDPSPAPSTSTTLTAPTAPTTTTAPPSDSEMASGAASDLLRSYYAVRNQLRQDPAKPLRLLKTVAISSELAAQRNLFRTERRDGLRQTGESRISELTVQSVSLDNSDPSAGKVPTAQIDVCFDVSGVDVVDSNGTSVVSPDRPDTGWIRYSVANYEWDTDPDGGWRVVSSQDIERAPCDAS